jgi:branched-chain amino acid transport system ATP-binding protein
VPSLLVHDLSKSFGGVQALRGVSFEVEGTGCLGIVGTNGSGKSTLLGLLSGVLQSDSGDILVDGRSMAGRRPAAFRRAGVTRCFQYPRLVPNLRIWENIVVGHHGVRGGRAARRLAVELGYRVGLEHELHEWPEDVPLNLHRRVEIARALIGRPRILLLDEPAAGLTEQEAVALVDLLRETACDALTIIVEHNLHVVDAAADRLIVLLEGTLVEDGDPSVVRTSPVVVDAYLGTSA